MEAVVVISTYNGERVIKRQMETLYQQTWPIRVVIRDDCSIDKTVELVEEYIQAHHLENWILIRNQQNLGWKKNFMEGLRTCGGDVIFLCDQDDIWYPNKVETMIIEMEKQKEILLLSCDMNVVYEQDAIRAKIYHQKQAEKHKPVAKYLFTNQFFKNPRPGCSYAVRRSLIDDVQDFWQEGFHHDEFLWLMAAMQDGAYFCNTILMDYVRSATASSDIRYKDIQLQKDNLQYIKNTLNAMEQYAKKNPQKVSLNYQDIIKNAQIWCLKRQRLMNTQNPFQWVRMMPYWKYYNSPMNCLSDLYLVLFGSFTRKTI